MAQRDIISKQADANIKEYSLLEEKNTVPPNFKFSYISLIVTKENQNYLLIFF